MPTSQTSDLTTILQILKSRKGEFISTEELSKDVEPNSLQERLHTLESQGYEMEIHPTLGVRLNVMPDVTLPHEIYSELDSIKWVDNIFSIVHHDIIASTNEDAKDLARRNAVDGTLVIADHQTKGRGRLGRQWVSPPGVNLLFSLILRPRVDAQRLPFLTILTAAAVATSLRRNYALPVMLKWPNDLILHDRKLGGILTEGEAAEGLVRFGVVGIGINVNCDPEKLSPELSDISISMKTALGKKVHRAAVLAKLLAQMREYYRQFLAGNDKEIVETWKSLSNTLGRSVRLSDGTIGYAEDIDNNGALILRMENGIRKHIWEGDLTPLF